MPLPKPLENESKQEFLDRFMSDANAMEEFTDGAKRLAVANSTWEGNEIKTISTPLIKEFEEVEGEFYSEGFVATTHPDRSADGEVDGDILSKEAIQDIVNFINEQVAVADGPGGTRLVSYRHDWVKENDPTIEPAGIVLPPAEVREMDNGHFGAWVKVHHNKNHPLYEKIIYEVKNGYLPGYSIEYIPGTSTKVNVGDKVYRFLKSIKNYVGHAFANARMIANPQALIESMGYKELALKVEAKEDLSKDEEQMESKKMDYEKLKKKMEDGEELSQEEKEFVKAEDEKRKAQESKEETEETKKPLEEEEKPKPDSKELKFDLKEVVAELKESPEFKEAIQSLEVKQQVLKTQGEQKMGITIKEMNDSLKSGLPEFRETMFSSVEEKKGFNALFKEAIRNNDNYTVGFDSKLNIKTQGKGLKIIKIKDTLVPGDNTSSYTQEDVEFADVFAAGIIDTFNNQTNLFGFLKKEQHPQGAGEYYQWKMVTNRDPNSDNTFVANTSIAVTGTYSAKENYRTPLKIARRTVSVSDFINRYSARSLGDSFRLEVDLQMLEMMTAVNAALFAEVADGAGVSPLGLHAVADSAGNTTLYGKTRSVANRLAPTTASDTYVDVSGSLTEGALRTKISYLETEGTKKGDIVIVTSPSVRDYMFNLFDGNRRFGTVEAAFGFDRIQVPTYDGVPIVVDSDCPAGELYVIDSSSQGAVIVTGLNPQIVNLAKVGMSSEAVIEMHFAFVYKQPRRIGMLDGLTGPAA